MPRFSFCPPIFKNSHHKLLFSPHFGTIDKRHPKYYYSFFFLKYPPLEGTVLDVLEPTIYWALENRNTGSYFKTSLAAILTMSICKKLYFSLCFSIDVFNRSLVVKKKWII